MRIGIDVSGTNADALLLEGSTVVAAVKSSTTPEVTSGIVASLRGLHNANPFDRASVKGVMIGTTYFINAIVEAKRLAPTGAIRLSVAVGSDVVLLKRLRRLEGEPLMTSTTWLPADLCPGLETADVSNRSLYELLSAEHHHTIVRGTRTLEAVLADHALAALLETRKGNPLVRLEILSYVASGRALEYSVAYHRGDRARFEFDVANTQSAPEEMA